MQAGRDGGTPATGQGGSRDAGTGADLAAAGGVAGAGGGTAAGGRGGTGGMTSAGGAGGATAAGGAGGAGGLPRFSFFMTSLESLIKLSGSQDGFGGDLRYNQADGLTGADKICHDIAEISMPGSGAKGWRAFLSTTTVDAESRIGNGPWYDRRGRLVSMNKTNLLQSRPVDADPAIKEDLPNEFGVPNRRPDPTKPQEDNHHALTGSSALGKLYGPKATCLDWTSKSRDNVMTGRPRIGFSWSISNRVHWISGQDEGGCGAGVNVGPSGGSNPANPIVGSGGGYGGFYCFALVP
jgi:hypothetical protein